MDLAEPRDIHLQKTSEESKAGQLTETGWSVKAVWQIKRINIPERHPSKDPVATTGISNPNFYNRESKEKY